MLTEVGQDDGCVIVVVVAEEDTYLGNEVVEVVKHGCFEVGTWAKMSEIERQGQHGKVGKVMPVVVAAAAAVAGY